MTCWICFIANAIVIASLTSLIEEYDPQGIRFKEERTMLVLARKENEWVTVYMPDGRTMKVGVVAMRDTNVRIGFDAPDDIKFERDNAKNKPSNEAGVPLGEHVRSLRPESGGCSGQ